MNPSDIDLIAFGILLGSRRLSREWTKDWDWGGLEALSRPFQEIRDEEAGEGMASLLERLAVPGNESQGVTQKILENARLRHSQAACLRIAKEIQFHTMMRADKEVIVRLVEDLRAACDRADLLETGIHAAVRQEKGIHEEVCRPETGGVVEGGAK